MAGKVLIQFAFRRLALGSFCRKLFASLFAGLLPLLAVACTAAPRQPAEISLPISINRSLANGLEMDRPNEMDLSGIGWKLWRDKQAQWKDDQLFLPPVNVASLPNHPPTVGWANLFTGHTDPPVPTTMIGNAPAATAPASPPNPVVDAHVPGTVEEFLWGIDGDPYGTNGHYQGVSFWWRNFTVPPEWQRKKLLLHFGACRYRAEVYVNEKLTGYDCVAMTPFDCDITSAVQFNGPNRLCVRITDPNSNDMICNYDWGDFRTTPWGPQRVVASHGFSGIPQPVSLSAVDPVFVNDVYIKNLPSPSPGSPTNADVDVRVQNDTPGIVSGTLTVRVISKADPANVVFERSWVNVPFPPGQTTVPESIQAPNAHLWNLDSPNLYHCVAQITVPGLTRDEKQTTFGFRWFAPDGLDTPHPILRLNGKRIVIRSAISWNYFPINGIYPTPEIADRNIRSAKALGLNTLSMHRSIADPLEIQKADELGLLLYCEPGGYKSDQSDPFARQMARDKLFRMIARDRSHPSVAVWAMINEMWVRENTFHPEYLRDIVDAHALDPSRIIVLASGQTVGGKPSPKASWLTPYDFERREFGWASEHNAAAQWGVYFDEMYREPGNYYLNGGPDGAIIYWGEEGAISSPPQLEELVSDAKAAGRMGWDGDDYARWLKGYNDWLDAHHARGTFATADDLARAMGDVAYYYQGRAIEGVRTGNRTSGYVINGWEGEKLENHSGIVDSARRTKGDVPILAYYNQPLYIAVKLRHKVAEINTQVIGDFYIVNENNLHGDFTLRATATGPDGKELFTKDFPVKASGGDVYGELLQRDVTFDVGDHDGYVKVNAQLLQGEKILTQGHDEVFVVDYHAPALPAGGQVIDAGGTVAKFLTSLKYDFQPYSPGTAAPPFIIAGSDDLSKMPPGQAEAVLDRVKNDGTTLIAIGHDDQWADLLQKRGAVKYEGVIHIGGAWTGGGLFVLDSPLFAGLPQKQAMNWEYQRLIFQYQPPPGRHGLLLTGDQTAAGCFNSHNPQMGTTVGIVPLGKGQVILCTLEVLPEIAHPEADYAPAKRLLVNFMQYSASQHSTAAAR